MDNTQPDPETRIALFQRKEIRRTIHNNEWWFVITDVIAALTDSVDPQGYVKDMRRRDPELSKGWGQIATPLSIATAGGSQKLNCANTEGIFRLIQSIPSPKAEPFKRWLAKVGYDGSLPGSIYFYVPARAFFEAGSLWWNGVDGFSTPDGKAVFRDPSASEGGPSTLLADLDDLLSRLKKLDCCLVWTLLGEKWVLGDGDRDSPRVTYSQTASLNKDGTIVFGDRVFFDDYDKDRGLAGKDTDPIN
jgi:hypothetical protein